MELSWWRLWPSPPIDPIPPLHRLPHRHQLTPPRTVHPCPLLPPTRQTRSSLGITTYPSFTEWLFLTTMNTTVATTTNMKKSKEATYFSERLENQKNYKITESRFGSGELTTMVIVTKKHLYFQINCGSVYRGFFFVK